MEDDRDHRSRLTMRRRIDRWIERIKTSLNTARGGDDGVDDNEHRGRRRRRSTYIAIARARARVPELYSTLAV